MKTTATLTLLACTLLCVACSEPQKETFTDTRDKKNYKTVKIGEQIWFAENLNYKTENSLCYGEDGEIQANCDKYGRLYDWEAAMEACPNGWHLPSDEEWAKLYSYVGGSEIAGKHLKSKSGWTNEFIHNPLQPIVALLLAGDFSFSEFVDFLKSIFGYYLTPSNGEDTFGFTALPGGYAFDKSFGHYDFHGAGLSVYWWTSSLRNVDDDAYDHGMHSNSEKASRSNSGKSNFRYVRCLLGASTKTKEATNNPDPICAKKSPNTQTALAQQKSTFTDARDSKEYETVKIGKQVWMAENLNYNASGSKCYGNKPDNCCKYGRLYNWETAMKACPDGWHLPSNAEWDILYRYADGTSGTSSPYESETAGKFLKATTGWNDFEGKSGNGEDKFGFSALPGGGGPRGSPRDVGSDGLWWSSSECNSVACSYHAYGRGMYSDIDDAGYYYMDKGFMYSVRCLQE